ncbi:MAG: hypothetical protein ACP5OE_08115 [Thermodesulfobium sp.]
MGSIFNGAPRTLIEEISKRVGINTFIETGTYYGETAIWATKHFQNVYSIEASEKYFEMASRKYSQVQNLHLLLGNSASLLPKVISVTEPKRIFWLDAHFMGGTTYGQLGECPLLAELTSIPTDSNSWILIDDARYFISQNFPILHDREQWPNIGEIVLILSRVQESSVLFIFNDVIVSPPKSDVNLAKDILYEAHRNTKKDIRNIYRNIRNVMTDLFTP